MKLLNLFLVGTLAAGFAACSSDEPAAVNGAETETTTESNDGLYATVKFSFPQSRSTASEGVEVGQNYENAVNSVLVVAATKDDAGTYKFLTAAYNDAGYIQENQNNVYTLLFQDKAKLVAQAGKTIYLFAYCNPTQDLINQFCGNTIDPTTGLYSGATLAEGAAFTDLVCDSVDHSSTWKQNGFLMSNVDIVAKNLPAADALKGYNSPANTLNLGDIQVIRTAARFDLKDGSANKNYVYDIVDASMQNEKQGQVKLTRVAMFNTRQDFYYLPRVGTAASSTLCPTVAGMEVTGDNFVLTPATRGFYNNLVTIDPKNVNDQYKWSDYEAVLNGVNDTDEGWPTDPEFDKEHYFIWNYTTENAFAPDVNAYPNAEITGVVFEAEITGVQGQDQYENMYMFEDHIYGDVDILYNVVKNAPGSKIEAAFNATFEQIGTSWKEKQDAQATTEYAGFTIYRPTNGKHYCYYFYYNRHNDNGDPASTGNMEFATVRNNVYKLCVKNISKFGTFIAPDPTDWDVYFNVTVQVKPWVVRINDIEF